MGERTLYQVNDIFMAEGIIRFEKIKALRLWNVDANAQVNVGTTNLNGRGNLSAETTPTGASSEQDAVSWRDNAHRRCHNQSSALVRLLTLKTKTFVPSFER